MISRKNLSLSFILNLLLITNGNAAVIANLSFITPTGTASPTDSIEVWVRLSLDSLSDPFTYDSSLIPTGGIPLSLFPTEGYVYDPITYTSETATFATYTYAGIGTGYDYMHNNFINECTTISCGYVYQAREYKPGSAREISETSLILNPGESRDILHGTFYPKRDGAATPKNYTLYNVSLVLGFTGLSTEGEEMHGYTTLAATCPTRDASCAFTRSVSTVPLPASFYLLVSGLTILFGMSRRKNGTRSTRVRVKLKYARLLIFN